MFGAEHIESEVDAGNSWAVHAVSGRRPEVCEGSLIDAGVRMMCLACTSHMDFKAWSERAVDAVKRRMNGSPMTRGSDVSQPDGRTLHVTII